MAVAFVEVRSTTDSQSLWQLLVPEFLLQHLLLVEFIVIELSIFEFWPPFSACPPLLFWGCFPLPRGVSALLHVPFLCHYRSWTKWHLKVGKTFLLLRRGLERVASLLKEAHLLEVWEIFVRFPFLLGVSFVQTQMCSPFSGVKRTVSVSRSAVGLRAYSGMPLCNLSCINLFSQVTFSRFSSCRLDLSLLAYSAE